jgi:GT2 family glycosyltransferase
MKNNIVVVFSSHLSKEDNDSFIKHIDETIGVKHKTICYPNFNQYSLSEIYNNAILNHIEKDCIFVVCHNDIVIKTKNWGRLLLTKYNNTYFDIIGVAGSTYLPNSGRWWDNTSKMCGIVEHTDSYSTWVSKYSEEIPNTKDVVLIDGLFMTFNPDTIIHKFDEDFKGFHFYDLGFCTPNYLDGCNIGVTTAIRILHKSIGMTNQEWENNRAQFVLKYKNDLPLTVYPQFDEDFINVKPQPKVSVIIPTKNHANILINNINSWNDVVNYENYEILIADTGSNEETIKQYDQILSEKVKLVKYDYYNFGKINNDMVKNHISPDSELILFCNDDVKLLNDVLSRCVNVYNNYGSLAGTIGIRLHYADASIQHNGITIVRDNTENIHLSHADIGKSDNYSKNINYNSLGNTGAFLLINKTLFNEIGCFNENYIECFEDVELNMECLLLNKKNITVSDAVAFHYESLSRNKSEDKIVKLNKDYFERLHPFYLKNKEKLNKFIRLIK